MLCTLSPARAVVRVSDKHIVEKLSENYPLLSIIVGAVLVSASVGPYQNGDTQWEFEAASGVLRWGMPYVNSFGNLMNQPPLGFYTEALFFKAFGLSITTGTVLIGLFGLGCIVLVYKIGEAWYGKTTGLLAAALFAFTPWELVLSRSFLIDTQCLFFSLLYLFVGTVAVRRGSFKLFMVSGALFAAAFLTKAYAVFALIPLLLMLVHYRPKSIGRAFGWLAAFFLPAILSSFLWYQVVSGQGMLAALFQGGVVTHNVSGVVPTPFFVANFLENYGLGWFFLDAAVLSLLVCVVYRKFRGTLFSDLTCLVTILAVLGVNTFLGAALNLKSPYLDSVKFDYQTLPFFCLLAASLAPKILSMLKSAKLDLNLKKLKFSVGLLGLTLLAASLAFNFLYIHNLSTANYLLFRVEPNVNLGYSLFDPKSQSALSLLTVTQYLGFAIALSGLGWAGRKKLPLHPRQL